MEDSKFNMWRAICAVAHADGVMAPEERDFLIGHIERLSLPDEKKAQLKGELQSPVELDDVLPLVTKPAHRSLVIHFARVLAFRDGSVDPSEKAILDHLHSNAMKEADVGQALAQARSKVAAREAELKLVANERKGIVSKFIGFFFDSDD